jgi:hypothetical protein
MVIHSLVSSLALFDHLDSLQQQIIFSSVSRVSSSSRASFPFQIHSTLVNARTQVDDSFSLFIEQR